MNKNTRRFIAAVSLTFVLGSTPAIAAPRDGSNREPSPIVKVLKRLLRVVGMGDAVTPIPGPSTNP